MNSGVPTTMPDCVKRCSWPGTLIHATAECGQRSMIWVASAAFALAMGSRYVSGSPSAYDRTMVVRYAVPSAVRMSIQSEMWIPLSFRALPANHLRCGTYLKSTASSRSLPASVRMESQPLASLISGSVVAVMLPSDSSCCDGFGSSENQ